MPNPRDWMGDHCDLMDCSVDGISVGEVFECFLECAKNRVLWVKMQAVSL